MKKINFLFSLLCLFLCTPFLFSQSHPIVQVDPVINLSDEVWLDAVCDAATDNVLFTLKFLGQFDVISDKVAANQSSQLVNALATDNETIDTFSLKARAEADGYDNILFGSCTIDDGSYVITMNAYDLALDKITYSGSTEVESIFDTFEAVDEITYQTVEGFSGIHVTYGSLVLIPPNTGEPFSFTIDGIALPEGTFSVERMPAGVHELSISQVRSFEWYDAVHEIIVEEEKENRIEILLPVLVGEEIAVFNQADRYLALVSLGEISASVRAVENLNGLLRSSFFQEFRSGLVRKYEAWISMFNRDTFLLDEPDHSNVSLIKRSLWDSERQKNVSNSNVSLSSQFSFLLQDKAQLKSDGIYVPEYKTIIIDGKRDDWSTVSTVFEDNINDLLETDLLDSLNEHGDGQDIASVGIAADNKRLYLFIETVNKKYRIDRQYKLKIIDNDFVELRYDGRSNAGSEIFGLSLVKDNDRDTAKNYDISNSSIRGRKNEIVEISFPLEQIESWLQSGNGIVTMEYSIQRVTDPFYHIDNFEISCILPSYYYAFRNMDL